MSGRAKRACLLLLYPPGLGIETAVMAPLFGTNPVVMLPVGLLVGWVAVVTYLLITEAAR
jgi:hypothetical protein